MNLAQLGSRDFLKAVRPFVGLFMVLLLFAMDAELRSLFFKGGNFKTILTQTVIVAIGAMGMTLVIDERRSQRRLARRPVQRGDGKADRARSRLGGGVVLTVLVGGLPAWQTAASLRRFA